MRLLMWLALGLLIYLALRSRFQRRRSRFDQQTPSPPSPGSAQPKTRSTSPAAYSTIGNISDSCVR